MSIPKKIYHRIFIASSLRFLCFAAWSSLCSLSRILLLQDIKITDVMAFGLSGLVEHHQFGAFSDPVTTSSSNEKIVNISAANYQDRASAVTNSSKTIVLNFQGVRMSSVPSPRHRSKLYANLMFLISSKVSDANFLILEHKIIDGFARDMELIFDSLISRSSNNLFCRPSVQFLYSKNLDHIQQAAKCSSYYLGSYGTDATIFLMEGTPSSVFNCGNYAMRTAFEKTDLSPDLFAFAKFLKVKTAVSDESFDSCDQLNTESKISLKIASVITHIQSFAL